MATSPAVDRSEVEARTIRKVRSRIVPFVFVLFVIAFIDRINIGFAALTMNKALAITSQQFGLLSGIFFCGYFLFEIPSNLLLHKLGARIWIARILVSWGIVAVLTGLVTTATHLYILRFLGSISFLLLATISGNSMFLTVALWCVLTSCIESAYGPIFSLPNGFLTGFSAAAGIALINSIGSLGGFVGPYAFGAINKRTGSFSGGLVFAGVSLFASAILILALRQRIALDAESISMTQASPVALTTTASDP